MAQPGFWNHPEKAQKTVEQLKELKALIDPVKKALAQIEEIQLLWQLAEEENDQDTKNETVQSLQKLIAKIEKIELASLLDSENDMKGCFFGIHAGAGGTESCDWASILLRMYTRYFDRNGYKYEQIEITPGEEAGIRSILLRVAGPLLSDTFPANEASIVWFVSALRFCQKAAYQFYRCGCPA